MADTKTTALPENTTPVSTDVMMIVDDPGGTAASEKITLANLLPGVMLHDKTLGSAGAFDVSSISQDYDDLLVIVTVRTDAATSSDTLYMYFNNDTTDANYHSEIGYHFDATAGLAEAATPGVSLVAGNTAPANVFSTVYYKIPSYADTLSLKVVIADGAYINQTGSVVRLHCGMSWEDGGATAINRITVQPNGYATDKFVTGSRLRIIGIKYS